ncbi:flagellar hook-length control protein FliK [bacterium]|nr:flagellar hook-length control protein FliK [bacterium]NBX82131.1 flagellar hook-length control protein FliK [bacterium]
MINPIQSGLNPSSTQSMLYGNSLGISETGEFDFLNYLLGLQIDSSEADLGLGGLQLNGSEPSAEVSEPDSAILKLFDKKQNEQNMPLFFGNGLGALDNASLPKDNINLLGFTKSAPKEMGTQFSDIKNESRTVKKEETSLFEDPLMKASFEAALMKQDSTISQEMNVKGNTSRLANGLQREKLVQAFKSLDKAPALVAETSGFVSKVDSQPHFETIEPSEVHEKSRKKSVDALEAGIDGIQAPSFEKAESIATREQGPQKILQVPVPEVFQKVESVAQKGGGKMTLVLSPPELGQVEIHVSTKGKNVEVTVKSDNDFAKAAIEGQIADLQQSLQNQDLNLSKIEVHVSREMDPSFLENQFAGFNRQGNLFQQSDSYRQEREFGKTFAQGDAQVKGSRVTSMNPIHRAIPGDSRVDIRI